MRKTIEKVDLANFGSLELLAKQVVEGFITGMHKSPFHGFSVEFAEHRLYNSGESTRHLDWKLFARTEKLFTKKYEEETNLRCQIVLDISSSMWFPQDSEMNKIRYSAYSAASLIELLRRQRDAVGLTTIANNITLHTPAKSSVAHHRVLWSELEKLLSGYKEEHKQTTSFINHLHDVAELCHKRSMIVLFTDLLQEHADIDGLFNALQHLKHNKHEVVLFHVHDKKLEVDFELDNRPYTVVDMETGERIKLQSNAIKQRYKESVEAYFEEITLRAKQYGIDFVEADIHNGFETVFVSYLIKRQRMGR
jgi:uncharacterized protein (DUF58 family)